MKKLLRAPLLSTMVFGMFGLALAVQQVPVLSTEAKQPKKTVALPSKNEQAAPTTISTSPSQGTTVTPIDPAPYRTGFTSLNTEIKYKRLPVEGVVPSWLHGAFMVAGPGKYEINASQARTWLDGFAMIHKFSFKDGTVSYANKFLDTNYYRESCQKGAMSVVYACDPNASYFAKLASALSDNSDRIPYDNANVTILKHDQAFFALTETPGTICFDKRTLKTKGLITFKDALKPHVSCAQPFIDPVTVEWINIATTFARKSTYTIYKMGPKSLERVPLVNIPVSYPSYLHSFGVTNHYIIMIEVPFVISPYDLLMNGKPYIENFVWKPKQDTKVSVYNRSNGALVKSYTLPAFFMLNQVNAFEDGSKIIMDIITYNDASILKSYNMKDVLANVNHVFPQGTLQRISIDTQNLKIEMKPLHTTPIEMPRINPAQATKRYQHVYALSSETGKTFYDKIVKINTVDGSVKTWKCTNCYPSEAVFIPNPHGQSEDDGILLSIVLDGASKKSYLLILNAKTMEQMARINLQHHIPFTVHGNYFAKPKPSLKEAFDAMLN